jgi:peptidoglycan/xylan/chitin deacetylase (PgdA/CDA1 family)
MKKILFNFLYNRVLSNNFILPFKKGIRYVFVFHDISDASSFQNSPIYSTDLRVFKDNIEWIQKNFQIVNLDQLTNEHYQGDEKGNYASIIFDDGFYSVLESAFPYLNKKKIPFAVFVNQKAIQENWLWCSNLLIAKKNGNGKYLKSVFDNVVDNDKLSFEGFVDNPTAFICASQILNNDYSIFREPEYERSKTYLDESDIKFLFSEGVIIGNHTKTHKHLSTCSDETIREEIVGNKEYLKGLLGSDINHFAIPFGFHTTYNEYAIKVAREMHSFVYDTTKNYIKFSGQSLIPRVALRNESKEKIISYINYPLIRNLD